MKCKFCKDDMDFIYCDDGATVTPIAYNLYSCSNCMCTMREDVWNFKAKIWIHKGEVYKDFTQIVSDNKLKEELC